MICLNGIHPVISSLGFHEGELGQVGLRIGGSLELPIAQHHGAGFPWAHRYWPKVQHTQYHLLGHTASMEDIRVSPPETMRGAEVDGEPSSKGLGTTVDRNVSEGKHEMSPKARILWNRLLTKIVTKYRVQRILQTWLGTSIGRLSRGVTTPCAICASMKLTQSKFIIAEYMKHRRVHRPAAKRSHDSMITSSLSPDGLSFGPHEFELGRLEDIFTRREYCPFCAVAVASLREQCNSVIRTSGAGMTEEEFYGSNIRCFVSWQIDGRISLRDEDGQITGSRPCTRRIRLRWDTHGDCPEIGDLFDTYVVLVAPESGEDSLFLGRSYGGDYVTLIRRWIQYCEASHGDVCKSHTQGPPASQSFFGVIDVKEMCLTKLPHGARYVALSYTWGQGGHFFSTNPTNIRAHLKPGGLRRMENLMPRTIRDAINLVKELGERYLWIDAVCIIQGDANSWALNSRIMDRIYGNALFTICAADGDNANSGLQILHSERLRSSTANKSIFKYSDEVRLMATQPAEYYIRKSAWNTRGWTFQERLLSPRNLIFTAGRMYFHCRCTARSTDIITEDENAGWSVEFADSPLLMLQKLPTRPLSVYKEALALYMTRQLSHPKDILAAFTGMGNVVCDALGGSLVYGLPSSHFDWALLWEPRDAATPRPNAGGERFPSWSWCGWKNQFMEYKRKMLAGCEENLHEWLSSRTWITWYIRDRNGSLRLVWDGTSKPESIRAEATSRGYHRSLSYDENTHDKFGRYVPEKERPARLVHGTYFDLTLDMCPYGVDIVGESNSQTDARSLSPEGDMPYLQFKTWSSLFRVEEDIRQTETLETRIFRRYSILDYKDDWCGTILLDKFWVSENCDLSEPLEFIALSDAKEFGDGEYKAWANYIPMTRKDSSWDLYYVMLIDTTADISRRVGLGKVFKEAYENSCNRPKQWKEFILG